MAKKKLAVIIPTYNERGNLPNLFEKLTELDNSFKEVELYVIFVDDNSPDKTANYIKQARSEHKFDISIIERPGKMGLGSAYIAGFKKAIEKDMDFITQMDADLSHNPLTIKTFADKLLEGYDFVIGSRYIKGGSLPKWSAMRKAISKGGNIYARFFLGWGIHDFTGGFNSYKKEVLQNIDLNSIRSNGYSFQIEMKYKAKRKGYKFVEVPIHFSDRKYGNSKFSKKIFKEALFNTIKLRFGL